MPATSTEYNSISVKRKDHDSGSSVDTFKRIRANYVQEQLSIKEKFIVGLEHELEQAKKEYQQLLEEHNFLSSHNEQTISMDNGQAINLTDQAKNQPGLFQTFLIPPEKVSPVDEIVDPQTVLSHEESTANGGAPILERGHIYFFYRPKIEHHEAHSLDDVQRLYVVLTPGTVRPLVNQNGSQQFYNLSQSNNSDSGFLSRLIIIPKKKLPDPKNQDRFYGVVAAVPTHISQLNEALGAKEYNTRTLGQRELEPTRLIGQGVYAIIDHSDHTHLCYVLELPEEIGEVQQAFRVQKEGSFTIVIKNPQASNPPQFSGNLFDAGTSFSSFTKIKSYPDELQSRFKGTRWVPGTPEFLNFQGCEMLLIAATNDLVVSIGDGEIQATSMSVSPNHNNTTNEKKESEDNDIAVQVHPEDFAEKHWDELRKNKSAFPSDPLITGKWM